MARDTEAKLFKYLDQNRQQIVPPEGKRPA
jgi:hypothetical protein